MRKVRLRAKTKNIKKFFFQTLRIAGIAFHVNSSEDLFILKVVYSKTKKQEKNFFKRKNNEKLCNDSDIHSQKQRVTHRETINVTDEEKMKY